MRIALIAAVAALLAGGAALAVFYLIQDRMIFHPRPYPAGYVADARSRGAVTVAYKAGGLAMTAYYVPPADGSRPETTGTAAIPVPRRLWLVFGGNGSLALHFQHLAATCPDRSAGFLLVEYPGYGDCPGSPSVAGTRLAANGAAAALARRMGFDSTAALAKSTTFGAAGHSLGAAVALRFADDHPETTRLTLLAPFTRLSDMVRRVAGPGVSLLLKRDFDNIARLRELSKRTAHPAIAIVHGARDTLIPATMSRTMAAEFGNMVTLAELPDADHQTVVDSLGPSLK